NSFISLYFFLNLTPIHRLTPIELIHCKLFDPCRTVFNCVALLVTNHVCIDSQRDPWITVPQLLLDDGRGCTIGQKGTGYTVSCRVEAAAWNAQLIKQRVQYFGP